MAPLRPHRSPRHPFANNKNRHGERSHARNHIGFRAWPENGSVKAASGWLIALLRTTGIKASMRLGSRKGDGWKPECS
eukprot:10911086-Alexandrium_andersonii.AAC.1